MRSVGGVEAGGPAQAAPPAFSRTKIVSCRRQKQACDVELWATHHTHRTCSHRHPAAHSSTRRALGVIGKQGGQVPAFLISGWPDGGNGLIFQIVNWCGEFPFAEDRDEISMHQSARFNLVLPPRHSARTTRDACCECPHRPAASSTSRTWRESRLPPWRRVRRRE